MTIVAINFSDKTQMVDIEPGRVALSTTTSEERRIGPEGLFLSKQKAVIVEPDGA